MIAARQGDTLELIAAGFPTGLTGTIGVQLVDGQNGVVMARTTAGIVETILAGQGTGIYAFQRAAGPPVLPVGTHLAIWEANGQRAEEQVLVLAADDVIPAPAPTAHARLAAMTQAAVPPGLSADELDVLLYLHQRPDAAGRAPTDAGWEHTYHLGRAAAEGWTWKAGKVAHKVDAAADGGSLRRSQAFEACMKMARRYAAQGLEGVMLGTPAGVPTAYDAQVGIVNAPEVDDLAWDGPRDAYGRPLFGGAR